MPRGAYSSIRGSPTDRSERRQSGRVRRLPERDLHGGAPGRPARAADGSHAPRGARGRTAPIHVVRLRGGLGRVGVDGAREPRRLRCVAARPADAARRHGERHVGHRARHRDARADRARARRRPRDRPPDGESAAARAAAGVGVPMVVRRRPRPLSRTSPRRPETGRAGISSTGRGRELAASFLERAAAAGTGARRHTRHARVGWRPRDLDAASCPSSRASATRTTSRTRSSCALSAGRWTPTASVRRCSSGRRSSPIRHSRGTTSRGCASTGTGRSH